MKIGRYDIIRKLGEGGMGAVYLAHDPRLDRHVAIKVIRTDNLAPTGSGMEDPVVRFRLEARAAASLHQHKGIVTIYDFGDEEETAFLVMEYVDGTSLEKMLGGVSTEQAIEMIRQAAEALDYAHARGVFHRDIKAQNLMVDGEGHVKIADFGVAKMSGLTGLTVVGMVPGTVSHMPPESLDPGCREVADTLRAERDQYSLGVVAFRLLSGELPFWDEESMRLAFTILQAPPPLEKLRGRGFPDSIGEVFATVLHKDPRQRYPSCATFASALTESLAEWRWPALAESTDSAALETFAEQFPRTRPARRAQARIVLLSSEAEEWAGIIATPSAPAIRSFLDRFRNGAFADIARVALDWMENEAREWEEVSSQNDAEAVRGFLDRYPVSPNRHRALQLDEQLREEEEAWRALAALASEEELNAFLARFPRGRYCWAANEELRKLREERVAWQWVRGTKDPDRLREFLGHYSQGRFADAARDGLAAVLATQESPQGPRAGEVRVNPKDGLNYVWIPPGRFSMGCPEGDEESLDRERPVREVEIPRGFWMGQTQVTQAAYKKVMGDNPSYFKGDGRPVERVDWNQVGEYCARVGMRLPTEAEWEYAARAGDPRSRYGELDRIAWYFDNAGKATHPVKGLLPNRWGLYDTLGNVWEWVSDWYGEYDARDTRDPHGPASGHYRVARGGAWIYNARGARASVRYWFEPNARHEFLGFRCAGESL